MLMVNFLCREALWTSPSLLLWSLFIAAMLMVIFLYRVAPWASRRLRPRGFDVVCFEVTGTWLVIDAEIYAGNLYLYQICKTQKKAQSADVKYAQQVVSSMRRKCATRFLSLNRNGERVKISDKDAAIAVYLLFRREKTFPNQGPGPSVVKCGTEKRRILNTAHPGIQPALWFTHRKWRKSSRPPDLATSCLQEFLQALPLLGASYACVERSAAHAGSISAFESSRQDSFVKAYDSCIWAKVPGVTTKMEDLMDSGKFPHLARASSPSPSAELVRILQDKPRATTTIKITSDSNEEVDGRVGVMQSVQLFFWRNQSAKSSETWTVHVEWYSDKETDDPSTSLDPGPTLLEGDLSASLATGLTVSTRERQEKIGEDEVLPRPAICPPPDTWDVICGTKKPRILHITHPGNIRAFGIVENHSESFSDRNAAKWSRMVDEIVMPEIMNGGVDGKPRFLYKNENYEWAELAKSDIEGAVFEILDQIRKGGFLSRRDEPIACMVDFLKALPLRGARRVVVETNVAGGVMSELDVEGLGGAVVVVPPRSPLRTIGRNMGTRENDFLKAYEKKWFKVPVKKMEYVIFSGEFPHLARALLQSPLSELDRILRYKPTGTTYIKITSDFYRNIDERVGLLQSIKLLFWHKKSNETLREDETLKVKVEWYDSDSDNETDDPPTSLDSGPMISKGDPSVSLASASMVSTGATQVGSDLAILTS